MLFEILRRLLSDADCEDRSCAMLEVRNQAARHTDATVTEIAVAIGMDLPIGTSTAVEAPNALARDPRLREAGYFLPCHIL